MTDSALKPAIGKATAFYSRATDPFAHYFARGKLAGDRLFAALLEHDLIPAGARVLDLGCGQGLLAAWLLANEEAATPRFRHYRGIELSARDAGRASRAFVTLHKRIEVVRGNIATTPFGEADLVTIFDVLHYLDHRSQDEVLLRVRAALRPGGRLLMRVGDADGGLRFHVSAGVDLAVCLLRGHPRPRLYGRSVEDWLARLDGLGFATRGLRLDDRKPFANVMIVADLPA